MFHIATDARFWDRIARKYATDPIADMAGYERTLERTRHYLKSSDTVFEFGCGTGTTALRLAPSVGRIVATDISGEMIAIAREKAEAEGCSNANFEVATPDAAPWPDRTFDAALQRRASYRTRKGRCSTLNCCMSVSLNRGRFKETDMQ
jgi:ubiquinone/menaquinone biosynthesis C-methylase UbiE